MKTSYFQWLFLSTFNPRKQQYLPHYQSDKCFQGTVVNRVSPKPGQSFNVKAQNKGHIIMLLFLQSWLTSIPLSFNYSFLIFLLGYVRTYHILYDTFNPPTHPFNNSGWWVLKRMLVGRKEGCSRKGRGVNSLERGGDTSILHAIPN